MAIDGGVETTRSGAKVFRRGPYALAFAGSFRLGDLLKHEARIPPPPTRGDLQRHLVTKVVPEIRRCFKAGGARPDDGEFIVAVSGRIFELSNDLHVGRPREGYLALGLGFAPALGALHATPEIDPRARVLRALAAAAAHSAHVRGPFRVLFQAA